MKRIVLGLALLLAPPVFADEPATMMLTGTGVVEVVPDMATISLGVTNHQEVAAEALAENSRALAEVFDVLAGAGIAEADIQTTRFDVQPIWRNRSYDSTEIAQIEGYAVSNHLTIHVRDLDQLGAVLDAVARAGANEFQGISFGLQDPGPATDAARRAAIADAQARAVLYAEAAGVDILGIITISETGGSGAPRPEMMSMATRAVPVAEGSLSITANVSITYEIGN